MLLPATVTVSMYTHSRLPVRIDARDRHIAGGHVGANRRRVAYGGSLDDFVFVVTMAVSRGLISAKFELEDRRVLTTRLTISLADAGHCAVGASQCVYTCCQ